MQLLSSYPQDEHNDEFDVDALDNYTSNDEFTTPKELSCELLKLALINMVRKDMQYFLRLFHDICLLRDLTSLD